MEAATGEVGRSSGKALHEREVGAVKNTEYSELAATATGLAQKVEERVNSSPFLFLSSQDLLTFGKPPWKRSHVNCGNNNPWKNINVGGREKGMCEFTPTCDGNCPRQVALSYVLEREKSEDGKGQASQRVKARSCRKWNCRTAARGAVDGAPCERVRGYAQEEGGRD